MSDRANLQVIDGGRAKAQDFRGKVPPHDLDAEADVLGEMLNHPELVPVARGLVDPSDFFADGHKAIAEAIWAVDDMAAAGRAEGIHAVVSVGLVVAWLKDRTGYAIRVAAPCSGAEAAGKAKQYLVELRDLRPSNTPAFPGLCQRVRDKARLRRLSVELHELLGELYGDHGTSVQAWLDRAVGRVRHHASTGSATKAAAFGSQLDEVMSGLQRQADVEGLKGLSMGIDELDRLTGGLQLGDMWTVSGPPGGGKTAWVLERAIDTASITDASGRHRHGVLLVSLEMPHEQLVLRAACRDATVDFGKAHNRPRELKSEEWAALESSRQRLNELPLVIHDRDGLNADDIRGLAHRTRQEMAARGIKLELVAVDYFQVMGSPSSMSRNANRYNELDESARQLVQLSKELGVALVLCAQLNQAVTAFADCTSLAKHTPNHLEIKIHKPKKTDAETAPRGVTFNIRKLRNGEADKVSGYFHGRYQRFTEEAWLKKA